MANEQVVLAALGNIPSDMQNPRQSMSAAEDWAIIEKMSKLLTRDERDRLATVYTEQTARKYHG
ncbi:MAG: hypothetical protein IJ849_11835 [Selenomonadaceae bacterium]|nr:hypothetical protein [Selenomonadaceae bacterium]